MAAQTPVSPLLMLPQSPLTLNHGPLTPGSPMDVAMASPLSEDERVLIERESDQLFKNNTVEQIKKLEKEKRLEIDRRKEDLRQMVGERYRDLIDAADSILHMKKCSEMAKTSVRTMEELCQRLQQTHFLRGSGGLRGPTALLEDHVLAAQVKLLADSPERIWLCLETRNYLTAAQNYLLSRNVFSQLSAKLAGGSDGDFSVVQKLWHSVSSFKQNIIQCSSSHLECLDIQQDQLLSSLCAIVLLEGSSPKQVFNQTLQARKSAIQSVFSLSGPHRSVKTQVCQLARAVVDSISHVANIFCLKQNGSSLMVEALTKLTKKASAKDVVPEQLANRLPESVIGFVPVISSASLVEIPASEIHSSTKDWLTMCVAEVCNGLKGALQHISTLKALAGIREAVHTLLSSSPGQTSSPDTFSDLEAAQARENWSKITHSALGEDFSVWGTFLRPPLLQRAKVLVDKHLSKTSSSASRLLDPLLNEEEQLTNLWCEENGGQSQISTLSLKTKACSPSVYSFCQEFDKSMGDLISDLPHFLGKEESAIETYWSHSSAVKSIAHPFPLFGDSSLLKAHVQEAALEALSRFLKNIDLKVAEIESSLKEQAQEYILLKRLVRLGSLCQCFMDCCSNFSYLASGCKTQQTTRYIASTTKKSKKEGHAAIELLQEKAHSIFRIWSAWCSEQIVSQLGEQFETDIEVNSLASALAWEEVQISEESESGEKVSSTIRVPAQCSVYVSSLLFALCQEISRVGGHAMNRSLLEDLSGKVLTGIVEKFESLLAKHSKIQQPCAIQLLFNVKFLSNVLVHSKNCGNIEKRLKAIIDSLQSFVDPFDLDVFMPYILSNLDRQMSRSSVLLGMLLAVKGATVSSLSYKKPSSSGSQEPHIIIPLAKSISRLATLPVTSPTQSTGYITKEYAVVSNSPSLFETLTFFNHL